ncbi:MAG: hypothetical protein M0C28_26240 [Candidatus Moduliflexus flocculans]|nr:hypothetical protein [Candidatus Moduliflexus flocculans]
MEVRVERAVLAASRAPRQQLPSTPSRASTPLNQFGKEFVRRPRIQPHVPATSDTDQLSEDAKTEGRKAFANANALFAKAATLGTTALAKCSLTLEGAQADRRDQHRGAREVALAPHEGSGSWR